MAWRGQILCGAALTTAGLVTGSSVWAQDGGLTIDVGVSQSLRYEDNPDFDPGVSDGQFLSRTGLSFDLNSETATQKLSFGLTAAVEAGRDSDNGLADPTARLSYTVNNRNTEALVDALWRERDVGTTESDDLNPDDLDFGTGTRRDTRLTLGLRTGIEAPFGVDLTARDNRRSYSGTSDPDFFDTTRRSLDATARFRIDPRITLRLIAGIERYEAENADQTDRTTTELGFGGTFEVTPRLTADVDLTFDKIETEELGGTTETDGIGIDTSLTREMANGTLTASLRTRETINGRRSTVRIGRALDLPDGALSFSLGATKSEGLSTEPVAELSYSRDLPRGQFDVSLRQSVETNNDDQETLSSRLSLGIDQDINSLSSWSADLSLADVNALDVGAEDKRRIDFSLSYRRDIGADWDLVSGYEFSHAREDGVEDREANTVFLTLEKTFSFRP